MLTRTARVKQRLLLAGAIYGSLLLLRGLYLAATAARVHALDRKLDAMRPQTVFIQAGKIAGTLSRPPSIRGDSLSNWLYQINTASRRTPCA